MRFLLADGQGDIGCQHITQHNLRVTPTVHHGHCNLYASLSRYCLIGACAMVSAVSICMRLMLIDILSAQTG